MNCTNKIYAPILCVFLLTSSVFAVDYNVRTSTGSVGIPIPTGVAELDPSIEIKNWWRGVSGDFEVISLDDEKGKWIENNINKFKNEILPKWGLPNVKITAPVRVILVPDKEIMKKLFRIEESRIEVFRDYKGEKIHVIYMVTEDTVESTVNPCLMKMMLAEFALEQNLKFPFWIYQGMSGLSSSPKSVRDMLRKNKYQSVEDVFSGTEVEWRKLDVYNRASFDYRCMVLTLLLRQEFGERNLHKYLKAESTDSIKDVYGFRDISQFDSVYKRYSDDLKEAFDRKRVPDKYLKILPAK